MDGTYLAIVGKVKTVKYSIVLTFFFFRERECMQTGVGGERDRREEVQRERES